MAHIDPKLQPGAQLILTYLLDLFTMGKREQFDRTTVLRILNLVKHDPDLFDEEAILASEAAEAAAAED